MGVDSVRGPMHLARWKCLQIGTWTVVIDRGSGLTGPANDVAVRDPESPLGARGRWSGPVEGRHHGHVVGLGPISCDGVGGGAPNRQWLLY